MAPFLVPISLIVPALHPISNFASQRERLSPFLSVVLAVVLVSKGKKSSRNLLKFPITFYGSRINFHLHIPLISDASAVTFADELWNLFFGGSSSTRPFGAAVLDGVDLDIENGGSTGECHLNFLVYCSKQLKANHCNFYPGYVAFINQLQTHFKAASKKYYVTAAPQCVYPDANLGAVINSVAVDAIYVQFCMYISKIPSSVISDLLTCIARR